jgi:NTE family protein
VPKIKLFSNHEIYQKEYAMSEFKKPIALNLIKNEDGQSYDVLIEQPPIVNLVFEGGGAKGIAYVGALSVLEKRGMLQYVDSVAGSSAGAIQALIYGLAYKISDMATILMNTNMSKFKDLYVEQKETYWIQRLGTYFLNVTTKNENLGRGLYQGAEMERWLKKLVEDRIKNLFDFTEEGDDKKFLSEMVKKCGAITFEDAMHIREKFPNAGFKKMHFTGTNFTKKRLEVFNENLTPDMPLYLAARISGTFPWFFKTVLYNGCEYMDGGVLNNFPMQVFDDLPVPKYYLSEDGANLSTLGIKVDNEDEIKRILWQTKDKQGEGFLDSFKDSVLNFIVGVDYTTVEKASELAVYGKYPHRSLQINDQKISTLNFDLSDEQKNKLIESGKKCTDEYLSIYFDRGTALNIRLKSLDELKNYL